MQPLHAYNSRRPVPDRFLWPEIAEAARRSLVKNVAAKFGVSAATVRAACHAEGITPRKTTCKHRRYRPTEDPLSPRYKPKPEPKTPYPSFKLTGRTHVRRPRLEHDPKLSPAPSARPLFDDELTAEACDYLSGQKLDAAVAKILLTEGRELPVPFSPSKFWEQAGPLIIEAAIALRKHMIYDIWYAMASRDLGNHERTRWAATRPGFTHPDVPRSVSRPRCRFEGRTPLVAAMRCYVAYRTVRHTMD